MCEKSREGIWTLQPRGKCQIHSLKNSTGNTVYCCFYCNYTHTHTQTQTHTHTSDEVDDDYYDDDGDYDDDDNNNNN